MACGYNVLTRTAGAGVDAFVKQEESLFVFFQGHPEYESDTLLYEYRRDVGRYLRRETGSYPLMPRSYFDRATAKTLDDLRDQALSRRNEELLIEVQIALRRTERKNTWQPTAASIYRNWLQYIKTRKEGNVCLSNVGLPAEARDAVSRSRFELRPFVKHRLEESKPVRMWKELFQWQLS